MLQIFLIVKLLIYPCSQNPLIPTKTHTEAINHIQSHINTHNKQIK